MRGHIRSIKFLLLISLLVCMVAVQAGAAKVQVAPMNPAYQDYLLGHRHGGLIPESVDHSDLRNSSGPRLCGVLPATYDLRPLGKLTDVRNQGSAGCCWAFASLGSLESYLMPGYAWDFSENNMKNLSGYDLDPNEGGGNRTMACAYLARWSGPVAESDDPYDDAGTTSPTLSPIQHVQDVVFIADRTSWSDNAAIKDAVMTYGAVYTTYCHDDNYYSSANHSYFRNGAWAPDEGHAVCIVGWDDSFPKAKFNHVPPQNGAFLVRNSWGSDWGDGGYYYISYCDSQIGKENAAFTSEETTDYDAIYQYDPLGWIGQFGFNNDTAWFANIFSADSAFSLSAASWYFPSADSSYTVSIYTSPTDGPLNGNGAVATKSGTMTTAGYHTIKLDATVKISAGQRFSVVVRLQSPGQAYPIAVEMPSGSSSKAVASPGQSYISSDGQDWTDLTNDKANANVCLKAFGDKILTPTPHGGGPMIIYVKPNGDDSKDASSWAVAKKTLENAIAYANAGDQIWVAAGTYAENITIKSGVALYGGFAGNETDFDQRNWQANPTVIDGTHSGTVATFGEGVTDTTRLDGFVVTNGSGTQAGQWLQGGGIYCQAHSSPTIANCVITNNTADFGAGIFALDFSRPQILRNEITHNTATYHGGGVYCWYDPTTTFRPGEVTPMMNIDDNLVTYNKAQWGSGIAVFGYAAGLNGSVLPGANITNNRIYFNGVRSDDMSYVGGGIYCENLSPANIVGNTIVQNVAGRSAGIHINNSSATILSNHIRGNAAVVGGGIGVYADPTATSNAMIANNEILGNVTTSYGIGIYLKGYSDSRIVNNTIAGNLSDEATGGIHMEDSSPKIENNIVAYNTCGITGGATYYGNQIFPTLDKNCVFGNTQADYEGGIPHTADIQQDPKFASIAYCNVHLEPGSPCIDAGDSSCVYSNSWTDADGQARIQGRSVDIGSDESDGTIWQDAPDVVIRVATDGNDNNPGTSWDCPKASIQAAIDTAVATGGDVWVKAGTYTLPLNDPTYGDTHKSITLRSFVHLYGGFNGTEVERTERDWVANPTIIQPEIQYKPLGPGQTEPDPTDESIRSTIVVERGKGISTIDGFTIGPAWADSGAAIVCNQSTPSIKNNTFVSCKVKKTGGAIVCTAYSSPNIINNTFDGCGGKDCQAGGAIAVTNHSSPRISNNVFKNNKCLTYGGAIYTSQNCSPVISNDLFESNRAGQNGGGVHCEKNDTALGPWVTNNTFVTNISGNGGAVSVDQAVDAVVANNIMACNATGIYLNGGNMTTTNNCMFENGTYNYSGTFPGANDIEADPQFVSFATGDYHIKSTSPCVDAGDSKQVLTGDVDMDQRTRVYGASVDIGADEWRGLYNESLTPNSGPIAPTKPVILTSVYAHPDGYDQLSDCYLLINTKLTGLGAIYVRYNKETDKLYVRNDANTGWIGGYAPGSSNVISNNQVSLDCSTTTVSGADENLTIKWHMVVKSTMVNKSCFAYMLVDDISGLRDGWDVMGSFVLSAPPTNVSLTPSSGSLPIGKQISLTSRYSDDDGYTGITTCYLLMNKTLSTTNAVYVKYDAKTNLLWVRDDADGTWKGGYAPGTAYTIENSYVRLYCRDTKISGAGPARIITWSVLLKPTVATYQTANAWMKVQDNSGLMADWTQMATFSISQPPVNVSLTPNKGTLIVQRYTTMSSKYSDPDGNADLSTCYFIMNTSVSGVNAVYLRYDVQANKLYLRNSANTDWGTGVTPGGSTILENNSCKLDCSQTTISKSGTNLTVNWKIYIKSAMLGKQYSVWQLVSDVEGQKTDYVKMGAFSLSAAL